MSANRSDDAPGLAANSGAPAGRGALRSALLIAGIILIALALRAPFTGVGPLLTAIRTDLGLSAVAAGFLTALPLLAFGLVSPLAPQIARRLGM